MQRDKNIKRKSKPNLRLKCKRIFFVIWRKSDTNQTIHEGPTYFGWYYRIKTPIIEVSFCILPQARFGYQFCAGVCVCVTPIQTTKPITTKTVTVIATKRFVLHQQMNASLLSDANDECGMCEGHLKSQTKSNRIYLKTKTMKRIIMYTYREREREEKRPKCHFIASTNELVVCKTSNLHFGGCLAWHIFGGDFFFIFFSCLPLSLALPRWIFRTCSCGYENTPSIMSMQRILAKKDKHRLVSNKKLLAILHQR